MSERNGCVCGQKPCQCPYRIEIRKRDEDFMDRLMGMAWAADVRHPEIYSALVGYFYGYTRKGVLRKARRFIAKREGLPATEVIEIPRRSK